MKSEKKIIMAFTGSLSDFKKQLGKQNLLLGDKQGASLQQEIKFSIAKSSKAKTTEWEISK